MSDRSWLLAEEVRGLAGLDAASIDLVRLDGLLEPQILVPAATAGTARYRLAAGASAPVRVTRTAETPAGSKESGRGTGRRGLRGPRAAGK